jgi:hypothetical protein
VRPGGFGLFGPRRPRDPERARKTAKILLVAGAVLAVGTVVQFVVVSRSSNTPVSTTHNCIVPKGATAGTEPPPGNIPELVGPLGAPDASYTARSNSQTSYVYCYNSVSEQQVQAALQYVKGLGYQTVDTGNPSQSVGFTSATAVPHGILLQVADSLDLAHAGTGSGHFAVTWIDALPKNG